MQVAFGTTGKYCTEYCRIPRLANAGWLHLRVEGELRLADLLRTSRAGDRIVRCDVSQGERYGQPMLQCRMRLERAVLAV